ncbi:hypothetical protein NN3_00700 [Nocardia neocaledoniensis NBRC 108232]|uniref:Uncharacterized protein n=1 Tax=Nocardia neocaledoniensis TaxID=236511 RepID=A0A317NGJ7_9NOCA|nr:hypothetical protein [Nocardia neocaledoniensis]PWV74441.1 hypothetical protein DFR69_106252 [Nocardia neocaledoniensis]GEM29063.1 hypothetical protein NN3_00700 [Nocardia neocaledoniensis NBRC 108232]
MLARTKPATSTAAPDPDAIITYLSKPITELRAAFDGTGEPTDALALLNNAITQLDATEAPYRVSAADLESTWTSAAADTAIPAIRSTRTQIVDSSADSGDFATLIDAAVGTNTAASAALDAELDDFATQARQILKASPNDRGVTQVIDLARQILKASPNDRGVTQVIDLAREMYGNALSTVAGAQADYDSYSNRLGEKSYTTPKSSLGTGGGPSTGDPSLPTDDTTAGEDASATVPDTTATSTDPVIAMQQALGTAAIEAATTVVTQLITSGAEVLTTLITEGAGVVTHAIDTLGTEAGDTITAGLTGTGDNATTTPAATNSGSTATNPTTTPATPVINFGGSDKPSGGAAAGTGTGTNAGGSPTAAPKPEPSADPGTAEPKPAAPTGSGGTGQPGVVPNTAGAPTTAVVPPAGAQPAAGADEEHKPRTQAGVTAPASIAADPASVVVPVIGAVPS